MLSCATSPSIGLLVGSRQRLRCQFSPSVGGPEFGDPYLQGFVGWHSGNFHWNAGVAVNAPIGDYREAAIANIAFHRWAADVFGAVTYLDMKTGIDLSGAMGMTFNGTNPATDYKTGTEFHLELSATQNLPNGFSFGVVSYFYDQISGDGGSGAKLGPFKGRVAAVGGSVGYLFKADGRDISTRVRVYRELLGSQGLNRQQERPNTANRSQERPSTANRERANVGSSPTSLDRTGSASGRQTSTNLGNQAARDNAFGNINSGPMARANGDRGRMSLGAGGGGPSAGARSGGMAGRGKR